MHIKLAAVIAAAILTPLGLITIPEDDPTCVPYYWYTVCRNPDNTWQICNLNGDGQCHSAPPPAAPIPGIPGS
jgi:hypothetical protein